MTREEIMTLDNEAIETRLSEIKAEINGTDCDVDALTAEVDLINERRSQLKATAEKRSALASRIAKSDIGAKLEAVKEPQKETRNSKEYIDAYVKYIKTGRADECRSLLTANATDGTVAVPSLVEGVVNTAWDKLQILSLVKQSNLKGNVQIGFEISATDAVVHTEGADAPDEEELKLGIVTMVPSTIKKWISFSDEVTDLNGEAFLEYIYSELTYRICKLAEDQIIEAIVNSPTTATETAPSVATITSTGVADFVNAVAQLSDEAADPVIVMNRQSEAYYRGLALAANYNIDIFDNLPIYYNNTLDVASDGGTGNFAIVGDFGRGVQANFPNGRNVRLKYDELSLAEKDLIKVVGRLPIATAVVNCGMFTVITGATTE